MKEPEDPSSEQADLMIQRDELLQLKCNPNHTVWHHSRGK